jgi:NDP-sugar pyrophosphorylase family protein
MELTLLVLAAGMGSRYGGLKQIDPVGPNGETILDYSVFDAQRAGFARVVFVIRRDIEQAFRDHIGRRFEKLIDVAYVYQDLDRLPNGHSAPATRAKPWGTGHAVLAGAEAIDAPFGVINADDFYGIEAYRLLEGFLMDTRDNEKAHYALVGYPLLNTLSEHGTVSRGICDCDDRLLLRGLTEHKKIKKRGDAALSIDETGAEHTLTGDEWVSMNMWGFTPSIFQHLAAHFTDFLAAHGSDDKAEFYITTVIDRLMAEGRADVHVLPSHSSWFGITYREDKPVIEAGIRELIENGTYPEQLWP